MAGSFGPWDNLPRRRIGPPEVWRQRMKMTDGLVVGRHVFYEDSDGTHAAIVAHVDNEEIGEVTLTVLEFNGGTFGKAQVLPDPKAVDGVVNDGAPTRYTWRWMYGRQGTQYTPGQSPGMLAPGTYEGDLKVKG